MIDKTLLKDVESQEKKVLDQLMKDKTVAEDGRKEAAWFLDEMSSILNTGSDKQAFMLLQRLKAFKNIRDQQLKEMSYNMQAYSLKMELTDPVELCSKMDLLFGKVNMKSTPYNVNMVQGMKISAICATPGEAIKTEKYVFLFNDTGGHISDIKIPGEPTDITAVPGGSKAVVLVDNKKLLFLEKDGTGTLHCKNIMKMAKGCNLITASCSKLYIAYKSEIIVMDINGHDVQYLKTLQMTSGQIQAFSVGKDDDVYYGIVDRLYCMKDYGEEVCLYQTQDLKDVSGIVLDTEGNVYICGKTSNNIHVLKQKDSSAQVLLREGDGLHRPSGICFDKFRNKLFVYYECTYDPIQVYNVTM
ncbi:TRIM56 [Mytilus edulis]|uniref:TRIM56 n=1 Tax=Mytilus edulis TaxID=6550 RepID=A0A8S3SYE5_MYTED|nr:TRIM56 [Mytilus edulis]